jgi:predicted transcriptional regulator
MSTIGHYSILQHLLLEKEKILNFSGLSDIDKKAMSTLVLVDGGRNETMHLNDIKDHALTASIPVPSLYRSFQTLINKGLINKVASARSELYELASS